MIVKETTVKVAQCCPYCLAWMNRGDHAAYAWRMKIGHLACVEPIVARRERQKRRIDCSRGGRVRAFNRFGGRVIRSWRYLLENPE